MTSLFISKKTKHQNNKNQDLDVENALDKLKTKLIVHNWTLLAPLEPLGDVVTAQLKLQ